MKQKYPCKNVAQSESSFDVPSNQETSKDISVILVTTY